MDDDHYEDLNNDEDPYFYEDPDDIVLPEDEDEHEWDPD